MTLSARFYPAQLIATWIPRRDVCVQVRPARPEDRVLVAQLFAGLSSASRHARSFTAGDWADRLAIERVEHVDYERSLALIALAVSGGREIAVGLAEYVDDGDGRCESALVVADAWQGRGLGRHLARWLLQAATDAGYREMVGYVLADNRKMLDLARSLGFRVQQDGPAYTLRMAKSLYPYRADRAQRAALTETNTGFQA